ncbi:hypothetical protein IKF87_02195 [Candidatus Saccharibacteria bacterium]|nr:hypothetical protein [Candidatus Saccharibacteria bacterium]
MATKTRRTKNNRFNYYAKSSRRSSTWAKRTILIVILITSIVVVIALVSSLFIDRESMVKGRISELASDYYENYYHPRMVNSPSFQKLTDLDAAMAKYHEKGFTPITLNELLTYNDGKNHADAKLLTSYCNPQSTSIKIHPDPPYDAKSYHLEINYSCNF